MLRKTVSLLVVTTLLVSVLTLAFNVQPIARARTITVPHDYSTIQEAIDDANGGDTIFVRAGTYYENVTVDKTVTLRGEDKTMTIIDGQEVGKTVTVVANNVIIEVFTVTNSGDDFDAHDSGILLDRVVGCSIRNNIFSARARIKF